MKWLHNLYQWTLRLAAHKRATWALFGVSFAESSFFPIPPDVMLVPMCVADRRKALWYATVCTVASVLGGVLGYAIGAWLFDSIGYLIISLYGLDNAMESFRQTYAEYGAWIILVKGLTPIPYKLVAIASGLAAYPLHTFIVLSVITRGLRFYLLAVLLYFYGEPIRDFIEKKLEWVTLGLLITIVGGFIGFKYLF